MKRILIFSLNYYPRFVGGAEVAIKEIADRIAPSDIEFHMVTLQFDSSLPRVEQVGNILVHRIGFASKAPTIADLRRFPLRLNKFLYQFLAFASANRLHRKYRYDGIWGMMAHATGIPAGLFKAFHPNVPYLLTLQEGDPPEAIERSMRQVWPLFVAGFKRADQLQAISTFLLAWGKRMGFKGEGVVIPNGVDTKRFGIAHAESDIAQQQGELGKKDGDVYLVTTSRLVRKNGIDTVIRALPLMPESVTFLIYGIGPEEAQLRALAKELDVESRARFMGEASHEDLPLILVSCDIFIRPSRSEGMGNSFIEAMAAGLPVVATQEGGIKDFLFDAKRNPDKEATGWAVDADAPEQIAVAVEAIQAHPTEVKEIVTTARTLALGRYSWDRIAGDMQRCFEQLSPKRTRDIVGE